MTAVVDDSNLVPLGQQLDRVSDANVAAGDHLRQHAEPALDRLLRPPLDGFESGTAGSRDGDLDDRRTEAKLRAGCQRGRTDSVDYDLLAEFARRGLEAFFIQFLQHFRAHDVDLPLAAAALEVAVDTAEFDERSALQRHARVVALRP